MRFMLELHKSNAVYRGDVENLVISHAGECRINKDLGSAVDLTFYLAEIARLEIVDEPFVPVPAIVKVRTSHVLDSLDDAIKELRAMVEDLHNAD